MSKYDPIYFKLFYQKTLSKLFLYKFLKKGLKTCYIKHLDINGIRMLF